MGSPDELFFPEERGKIIYNCVTVRKYYLNDFFTAASLHQSMINLTCENFFLLVFIFKYTFSTYYVLLLVLSKRDTVENRTGQVPTLLKLLAQ